MLVLFCQRRHFVNRLALVFVPNANLNLALRIEYIQLGHHQRVDAVDHLGVAQHRQVQPAAPARPSSHRTKLLAAFAYLLRVQIRHLRWKRPATHPRGVRLGNSQYMLDLRRRHTSPGGRPTRNRTRTRHVRISPVVNVQHRSLRAFKQHRLPFVQRTIHQLRGIANVTADFFSHPQRLFNFVGKINVRAVGAFRQAVFFSHHPRRLLTKQRRLQQIAHTQTAPRHLVFVRRTNSARSSSNLVRATRAFRGSVQFSVIRKNQMGTITDVQPPVHVYSGLGQRLNLIHQRARINYHAHADHRLLLRTKYPARNQLKDVLLFADNYGVPGIVSTGHAHNVVKRPGKIIHYLALALVTPLRSDHYQRFHHAKPFRTHTYPRTLRNSNEEGEGEMKSYDGEVSNASDTVSIRRHVPICDGAEAMGQ